MFLGFPLRYLPARRQNDEHFSGWGEVTDVLFISSRDGVHFQRGQEAIIRPGLQLERWGGHCNNMVAAGIVETPSDVPGSPNELSVYSIENYYTQDSCQLRRHTWRLDGFASITAPMDGGELVTRPIRFTGKHLEINFSASGSCCATQICTAFSSVNKPTCLVACIEFQRIDRFTQGLRTAARG